MMTNYTVTHSRLCSDVLLCVPMYCTCWSLSMSKIWLEPMLSTLRNICDVIEPTVWKYNIIHKTYSIAMPSEKDWAMATGNMCKKFGKVQPCSFWNMQADRQTDILITILCIPPGGKVMMNKVTNISRLQKVCNHNCIIGATGTNCC